MLLYIFVRDLTKVLPGNKFSIVSEIWFLVCLVPEFENFVISEMVSDKNTQYHCTITVLVSRRAYGCKNFAAKHMYIVFEVFI